MGQERVSAIEIEVKAAMNQPTVIEHRKNAISPFAAVSRETKDFIFSAVPANTWRAYKQAVDKFTAWLDGRNPTDGLLAEYVRHLHEDGKSPSTITIAVAAVNWVSKHAGHPPVGGIATSEALKAARKKEADNRAAGVVRRRGQVSGLTRQMVAKVCGAIEAEGSMRALRDSVMIQLMSDCLLRVSEAVAVNVSDLNEKTLFIATSKSDQEGQGVQLYVTSGTREVIERYRGAAGINDGALFRRIRKGDRVTSERLTAVSARRIIKARSEKVGFKRVSGHSMRVGSAVSLAEAGASVVDLQTAGRWRDPKMPAHYAAGVLAERGAVARFFERQ